MTWGIEAIRAERIALLTAESMSHAVKSSDPWIVKFEMLDKRIRRLALDILDLKEAWILSGGSLDSLKVQGQNIRQMKEDLSEVEVSSGMEVFLRIARLSALYFLLFLTVTLCIFDYKWTFVLSSGYLLYIS